MSWIVLGEPIGRCELERALIPIRELTPLLPRGEPIRVEPIDRDHGVVLRLEVTEFSSERSLRDFHQHGAVAVVARLVLAEEVVEVGGDLFSRLELDDGSTLTMVKIGQDSPLASWADADEETHGDDDHVFEETPGDDDHVFDRHYSVSVEVPSRLAEDKQNDHGPPIGVVTAWLVDPPISETVGSSSVGDKWVTSNLPKLKVTAGGTVRANEKTFTGKAQEVGAKRFTVKAGTVDPGSSSVRYEVTAKGPIWVNGEQRQ